MSEHLEPTRSASSSAEPRGRLGAPWSGLWSRLALGAGQAGEAPFALALSGGADSLFLLHVLAAARPRPAFFALHVDHGWRGDASRADAEACRARCAALGVDCEVLELALAREPLTGTRGQEARGRAARYAALLAAARARGARTLLTAHHADDALETLLMRLARGARLGAFGGLRRSIVVRRANLPGLEAEQTPDATDAPDATGAALAPITVVRPLLAWRAADIRTALAAHGITWREDATNGDRRFTRARVRHGALPLFAELAGPRMLENLRAFGAAVAELEDEIAARLLPLAWQPLPYAELEADEDGVRAGLGGWIASAELLCLPRALLPRALGRLVLLGTGRPARAVVLQQAAEALARGERARFTLPGGFALSLRPGVVTLAAPPAVRKPLARPSARQTHIDGGCAPRDVGANGARRGAARGDCPLSAG